MNPDHPPRPPMTLGNIHILGICAVVPTFSLVPLSVPAAAQSDHLTCTGIMTEVETRTSAWPLRVIHDLDGHYICTIDRDASGHDPLKPCSVGDKCRVSGTFHKVGHTYSIDKIISVDRAE